MNTKLLKILGAGGVLALLAGCVVESVYPFYTAKDLAFEPALLGRWSDSATKAVEYWEFAKAEGASYLLTTVDAHETNAYTTHFFHLQEHQFLDLRTTNYDDMNRLPLHLVVKISQIQPTLKLSVLNYDWLTKLVKKDPKAIRHIVVPENPDDTNTANMIYLTADTKELQKFILRYAGDTNAFSGLLELQRLP